MKHIFCIGIFGILGTIIRTCLRGFATNFTSSYQFFLPNCLGSYIIGVASKSKLLQNNPYFSKGIMTGFCGSLTTFSSWIYNITHNNSAKTGFFEFLLGLSTPFLFFQLGCDTVQFYGYFINSQNINNQLHYSHQTQGSDVEMKAIDTADNTDFKEISLIQNIPKSDDITTISISSEEDNDPYQYPHTPSHLKDGANISFVTSFTNSRCVAYVSLENTYIISCTVLTIILFTILKYTKASGNYQSNRQEYILSDQDAYACLLAPVGANIRFILCTYYNKPKNGVKYGTFASNMIAVLIYGCLLKDKLKYSYVLSGFCGTLSTVSSWILDTTQISNEEFAKESLQKYASSSSRCIEEKQQLEEIALMYRGYAYIYYFGTVFVAIIIALCTVAIVQNT